MVPKPCRLKILSIGSLGRPLGLFSGRVFTISKIASLQPSIPAPVFVDTSTILAFSSMVPRNSSRISSFTMEIQSSSTKSHLVSTTMQFSMPSRERMSKCSLVWGMIPSSAATTRSTISIPQTPETICCINFSCPGTSMTPQRVPSFKSNQVKPSSMVIPRSCSSFKRSVSLPVKARIRDVLPWSMCPAVPIMICFMKSSKASIYRLPFFLA